MKPFLQGIYFYYAGVLAALLSTIWQISGAAYLFHQKARIGRIEIDVIDWEAWGFSLSPAILPVIGFVLIYALLWAVDSYGRVRDRLQSFDERGPLDVSGSFLDRWQDNRGLSITNLALLVTLLTIPALAVWQDRELGAAWIVGSYGAISFLAVFASRWRPGGGSAQV